MAANDGKPHIIDLGLKSFIYTLFTTIDPSLTTIPLANDSHDVHSNRSQAQVFSLAVYPGLGGCCKAGRAISYWLVGSPSSIVSCVTYPSTFIIWQLG